MSEDKRSENFDRLLSDLTEDEIARKKSKAFYNLEAIFYEANL